MARGSRNVPRARRRCEFTPFAEMKMARGERQDPGKYATRSRQTRRVGWNSRVKRLLPKLTIVPGGPSIRARTQSPRRSSFFRTSIRSYGIKTVICVPPSRLAVPRGGERGGGEGRTAESMNERRTKGGANRGGIDWSSAGPRGSNGVHGTASIRHQHHHHRRVRSFFFAHPPPNSVPISGSDSFGARPQRFIARARFLQRIQLEC